MHFKHTFNWGGGGGGVTGLRLNNVLKAEWSCYSVAGLSLNKEYYSQILSSLTNLNSGSHFTVA